MHGDILLGNRPNFFVEHYDEESESAISLQKWKKYISMGKITDNAEKKENLNVKFWKNGNTEGRYWPKILKQGVFFVQIF